MKDRNMFDILQPVVIGLSSLILISVFIVIITIITDPGSVGRFFGEIVAGFNSTVK